MSTTQQPYVMFNFYPCGAAPKLRRKIMIISQHLRKKSVNYSQVMCATICASVQFYMTCFSNCKDQ